MLSSVVACTSASARSTSADRGCAASPSRRGCRSRCRACRGLRAISSVGHEAARHVAERPAWRATAPRRSSRRCRGSAATTRPSTYRKPRCCSDSTISTSSAVRQTPQSSGMPKSRLSAMAAPSTSARSQAAIAISQSSQSTIVDGPRVGVAAGLRQVAPAGDAEARRERLQQDRHQVRHHDHAEQRVAEARAAGEVGGPVARVHVADGHQVARARRTRTAFARSSPSPEPRWCRGLPAGSRLLARAATGRPGLAERPPLAMDQVASDNSCCLARTWRRL